MPRPLFILRPDQPLRINKGHIPGDRFLLRDKENTVLTLSSDRRLFDKLGNEYACQDETLMKDTQERTGVGPFSLPKGHWSEAATKAHDFQTSSKVYMESNPRSKSEQGLRDRLHLVSDTTSRKLVASVLSSISKTFSWLFWDVKKTRWK